MYSDFLKYNYYLCAYETYYHDLLKKILTP